MTGPRPRPPRQEEAGESAGMVAGLVLGSSEHSVELYPEAEDESLALGLDSVQIPAAPLSWDVQEGLPLPGPWERGLQEGKGRKRGTLTLSCSATEDGNQQA